jgi:predicted house-cleaning noncanonical NTP pyrophosphatase (MazG superfamily)
MPLALLDKAVEEAVELRDAPPEHRVEEIADILEVLDALQRQLGVAGETVRRVQQAKLEERGGFTEGFWLDS